MVVWSRSLTPWPTDFGASGHRNGSTGRESGADASSAFGTSGGTRKPMRKETWLTKKTTTINSINAGKFQGSRFRVEVHDDKFVSYYLYGAS